MAKILLYCLDKVGQAMAGPAIRYWEMAKTLSKHHSVSLMTHDKPDINSENFTLLNTSETSLREAIYNHDVVITQTISPNMAWNAKKAGTKLILDAYDPMPLENLEIFKHQPMSVRNIKHASICKQFTFDFTMADAVICANQRQHDLWMGLLLSLNKISPELYDSMPSLEGILGIVPLGLSSTPPKKSGPALREKFNIPANAKVLLWGGGIWNWFDPITLLHAMAHIVRERNDVHLVFMGIKHPNESIPEMEMCRETIELAKRLNLLDKHVHINFGWVPYEERQNYLLEADIGVSTHFDTLETQYSFRTRMLDYLWAGLPIIATCGDSFGDLITSQGLGITVPYQDSVKLASAITTLCDQPALMQDIRRNIAALRPQYEWQNVVAPLDLIIQRIVKQKPQWSMALARQVLAETWRTQGPKRIFNYAWTRLMRLYSKPKEA